MKFEITKWTVGKLLSLVDEKKINLNPPYQRNPIWTKKAQKALIESIREGNPIPNLFLLLHTNGTYEMVDGQQRTRALKLYQASNEIDLIKDDDQFKKNSFLNYEIPVTIITEISESEFIEEFYDKVNSSGLRLNRPETIRAKYFATKFLKVVEELNGNSMFQELEIIPATSQKRMMDRDLIEELASLILYGITDKKSQVDKIYQTDLNEDEINTLKDKFNLIISRIYELNKTQSIKSTRYRQRNDFYTLFGFIKDNLNLNEADLGYFYKLLLQFERGIKPNKQACKPLAEYAFNCVSQSNSSKARQARIDILNDLLLNRNKQPNTNQQEVIDYYKYEPIELIPKGDYYTFDDQILNQSITKREEIEE